MKLNARQQNILRATVRHYVSTAEPVGSKALVRGYNLQVSAATIRNVMGALEDSGLLYQPHTSAGRIPSDSGYRAYVDELMTPSEPLTQKMAYTLNQRLEGQHLGWDGPLMEVLLQESAQVLASLSGYIALVTMPQQRKEAKVKHIQMVRVSDNQLLLVVMDSYHHHSILMPHLPLSSESAEDDRQIASDRELQILSNFLTAQLKGRSLRDCALNWSELDQAFQRYAQDLQQAIVDLSRRSRTNPATQILISGLAEVLDQPEFSERRQIRSIVELLEDGRDQLWPLISLSDDSDEAEGDLLGNRRLRIWIGAENPVEPMRSCALVTTPYGRAPGPIGSLGVLGPTRMLYENAVAAVEAAANYLSDAMADTLERGNMPEGARL
jgi:heat-inducible transcriptional repressor